MERGSITTEEEAKQWFSLEEKAQALWTYTSDFLSQIEKLEQPDWQEGLKPFLKEMGKTVPVGNVLISLKEAVENLSTGTELYQFFLSLKEAMQKPLPVVPQEEQIEYNLKVGARKS